MSILFEELQKRQYVIEQKIAELEKTLQSAPESRLRISMSRGRPRFYEVIQKADSCGQYIPKSQTDKIRKLAKADYEKKILQSLRDELKLVSEIMHFYKAFAEKEGDFFSGPEETILKKMNPIRRDLIDPVDDTLEGYIEKWMEISYDKKGFAPDAPEYYTGNGIRVRSKTEWMIAEMLEKQSIPFHYEQPLNLKGFGMVHPDFTVLNLRQRKTMYWEHMGMMDNPKYLERSLDKVTKYEMNGYYPGENLILTHETSASPLNMRLVENMIEKYCM